MNLGDDGDWEEQDWEPLLSRIHANQCVPFLGAGANAGILPLGGQLAETLGEKYSYPLSSTSDLQQVSQFVALRHDRQFAKEEVLRILREWKPSARNGKACHALLAHLPFPLYITTNYDSLMCDALLAQRPRQPAPLVCQWNATEREDKSIAAKVAARTAAKPIVFYLHGSKEDPNSLVLTEDDYLEFLSRMIERGDLVPLGLQEAIQNSTIVFLGYRLSDWNFRILFQQLSRYRNLRSVAVFPPPAENDPSKANVKKYLQLYFEAMHVKVAWTTADIFVSELIGRYAARFGKDALIGWQ